MKKILLNIALVFSCIPLIGQHEPAQEIIHNTFDGTRVVVGHSVEMLREGDMDMLIGHKFGQINSGWYNFFGLDEAIIRIGFDYAPKDWINIGVGRSSLDKNLDGFAKLQLLKQQKGKRNIPVSAVLLSTIAATTLRPADPNFPLLLQHRMAFSNQLLIAKQFNERFSIQIMPTHAHYNLVDNKNLRNDVFGVGIATKYQIAKAMSFKAEYYYMLPGQLNEIKTNSLALGFDFDTGSHVFQTHISNSGGLMETAFIGNTTGEFFKGDIHMGFTISRVFRLKGRRY